METETDTDVDDKLEVEKIHDLFQGIRDTLILVCSADNSNKLTKIGEEFREVEWLACKIATAKV